MFLIAGLAVHLQAQNLAVSPKLIPLPDQGIYSTSSPYLVTLSNSSSTTLSISKIVATAPFAETNNCGASLAAGKSCTISVTFTPTAIKYYTGTVTVTDSAANSPQVINVNGNGVTPLAYTPAAGGFYYSHQIAGTPSTPQVVTLVNNQSSSITFKSIQSSAAFPFTTNCGNGHGTGTLAAGASCAIQVSFNPSSATTFSANLVISESAYGSPISIPLTGTGISGVQGAMITVKPPLPCILPLETQKFTAIPTSMPSGGVDWYVDGVKGGNVNVGTITSSGLYTAPSKPTLHIIKAVSQVYPGISGSANLTITSAPNFEIYPFVVSIPPGAKQTFQAQTCQQPDPDPVTFTVDNIPGGNSTVGTVTSDGVYTAPAVAGKHTVRVTDADLNRTSGGVVTVFSAITADFGGRAKDTAPVPADMFGYGRAESIHNPTDRQLLTDAGLTEARLASQASLVYKTQTPNWSQIDPMIASIQATGQKALLQLNQSPPWLVPSSGPCAGNMYSAPTDVSKWAEIAAAYVAHMDSAFPGVVQDYEILNEPNSSGMCSTGDHLSTYLSVYAAAAKAMKAQAARDGRTIRVGGPVVSGFSELWISSLLTNASTAPYVDFVSYHQYFFGAAQMQAKWDTYTGDLSLYETTQDPSIGAAAYYNKTLAQVALGKQPGGAQTPIYVTEFNTNWAFFKDCCRNDPTYGPVWTGLYALDMLNTVYNGSARVPNKLFYFAGNAYPYFCTIGVKDDNSDCLYSVGATPTPYPQYYAFQLLASPSYLGLSSGGYMAKSISTPSGGGGLATTAFYTSTQDAIVIINPTDTSYSNIPVTFANPGFSSSQATLYTVNHGTEIETSTVKLTPQGTSLTTNVSIPAYSVQAVSLK